MYVEKVGASGKSAVAAAKAPVTAKAAKSGMTDSPVKTESMDGAVQQNNKNNNNSGVAKLPAATYEAGSDKRTSEEKIMSDNEKIRKTIESFKAQLTNSEVKFGIHEKTNRVTIKIVDKNTDEVIKEIPPEKTLDMIAKCMEIAGVLVDERL